MSLLKRIGESNAPTQSSSLPAPAAPSGPSRPPANGVRPASPAAPVQREMGEEQTAELRKKVQERLVEMIDPRKEPNQQALVRQVEEIMTGLIDAEGMIISRGERLRLLEVLMNDISGLGPLEDLLKDESVSEIMVNGPRQIYVERKGKLERVSTTFLNDAHVLRIIDRIISPLGRRCDEQSPMVDARLQDGSRVNVIIRPLAIRGPTITIRKFGTKKLDVQDLIRFGTLTQDMSEFLGACIRARLNIVVAGGTGSGKTTTLNLLSGFIPSDERIVTIENAAELQLRQDHVVTLESRPPSLEGTGEITMMDLIVNSLRMRPDRIIVGECRGGEALAMLQAMNTGHDGSLTTAHANTPKDTISRLETMCLMAGMDLPMRAIREQIAAAVHIIVQQSRLKDGSRKITNITEVNGMEGEQVQLADIFVFEQTGIDERGKIIGRLRPTGVRPRFAEQFDAMGIYLAPGIFGSSERFT